MFEFDPEKSASNKEKHGIDFEEAQNLWTGNIMRLPTCNVDDEARIQVIGIINDGFWSAIITMRGETTRIISVRRCRNEEKEKYQNYFR